VLAAHSHKGKFLPIMKKPLPPSTIEEKFQHQSSTLSRRKFMSRSGAVLAGSALAGAAIPFVHAAEENTIRLALIGCGGRGGGAAANACDSPNGPVKMIAMADLFESPASGVLRAASVGEDDRDGRPL
jgi:hypothetical protein